MWGVAQLLNNLGEVARCEGDHMRAGQFYEESLALFRELGSSGDIARRSIIWRMWRRRRATRIRHLRALRRV
jgi:hypothetical protein